MACVQGRNRGGVARIFSPSLGGKLGELIHLQEGGSYRNCASGHFLNLVTVGAGGVLETVNPRLNPGVQGGVGESVHGYTRPIFVGGSDGVGN